MCVCVQYQLKCQVHVYVNVEVLGKVESSGEILAV